MTYILWKGKRKSAVTARVCFEAFDIFTFTAPFCGRYYSNRCLLGQVAG